VNPSFRRYAPPALTWATALILYAVISYPYHGVLLTVYGFYPQAIYVGACLLGLMLLFTHGHSAMPVEYSKASWIAIAGLLTVMCCTLVSTRNPTVIRDLLLLSLLVLIFTRLRGVDCLMLLRASIYLHVLFLLPALIIVALFYAGAIDWPTWRVERLGLSPANPLLVRAALGDFQYYLPWWLALVPHDLAMNQGFGLTFVRQPFVYIEPTDTWLYSGLMLWIAAADDRMPLRRFCIFILGTALAFSFSVAGILATAGAVMMCVGVVIGGRALVLGIAGGAVMLLSVLPIDMLLGLISENKVGQLQFYTDNIQILTNPTLFGSTEFGKPKVSYGLLTVLDRYGMVGLGYLLLVLVAFAVAAFHLLGDKRNLGWRRFPLFIGSAVALAMTMKYPGIVPAMPALALAASLSFRQYGRDPFEAAAVQS
jgi:hypothetical protein